MKMRMIVAVALAAGMAACSEPAAQNREGGPAPAAQAPAAPPAGGGLAGTPEQQAKQAALEKARRS